MGKWAKYKQNYSKEWESDDELKSWITPCRVDQSRATCKYCRCDIRAHYKDLLDHAKTQKHIRTSSVEVSLTKGQRKIDSVFKASTSKGEDVKATKIAELKLATHIAIHSPLSLSDHLVPVCKSAFPDSGIASRMKMGATKCTALVTHVLGPTLSEKLIEDIGNSKFSILVDESTDSSKMKHLCVVVRYFSEKQESIITQYLGLIRIEDASANGLYTAMKEFFKVKHIQEDKCIGLACDGASVMVGKHNSLYSRLLNDIPHLKLVQCMCHSLHLACSKSVEVLPRQLDYIIKETHNWFSCSPKRRETYEQLYQTINDESPLQIPGLADTRWLSRFSAVKRILDQWNELKLHFQLAASKEKCYTADSLAKMYNDEINLLFMKFLLPLLEKFQTMNLKFQAQNPDPSKLFKELSNFQCDIMSRVVNPNRMSQKTNWEDHIMHTDACFCGAEFQMACSASQLPEATKADIKERCRQFLVEAVREIKKRVPVSGNHLELLSLLAPTDISELSFTKIVPELKRMTE
ncbi:SCAN domain-containing protein 3-like [Macrobrachium rosenbergii]|uniref:SCAN domain-containing protein 3-like n=1 Tax=Macrobrachium rosenbergii TaxID=79674 RepID=UPI0034D57B4D